MQRFIWIMGVLLLLLVACNEQTQTPTCPDHPPAAETLSALLRCLDQDATPAGVEGLLRAWQRLNDEWGEVTAVDLLPAPGSELVISYHVDPAQFWDPQGTLVVLQWNGAEWEVAFDAVKLETTAPNGKQWDNWAYRIVEVGDATGDGRADLLIKLAYSNGTHAYFEHHALLTADGSAQLRAIFLDDEWRGSYRIVERAREPVVQFAADRYGSGVTQIITRTYDFAGEAFVRVDETINPALATTSARLPDGSNWYGFDQVDVIGSSANGPFGLYRVVDDTLIHIPVPAPVRALEATAEGTLAEGTLAEGTLYVGAGCGVLRYHRGEWQELAPLDCGADGTAGLPVTAMALGEDNTIWVGSPFSLAHYDGMWQRYPINATHILVAPDGSVWAAGWNGRAEGDCCFTHLTASEWVTYTYSAPLPVSPSLEAAIRALK